MDKQILIDRIYPHGVTYSKIGDVATIKCGVRITKSQIKSEGLYPVISGGINPMGYHDTYNRDEETITIVQYGTAGYVGWQEKKYWANDGCCTIIPSDKIDNRYLYHALKSKEKIFCIRNEVIPHLSQKKILDVKIPVPDLETQERIVRILNAFAELAGREKQYRYYLNNFYSPEYLKSITDECNVTQLSEIIDYEQPTKYLVTDTNYKDSYGTPVLTAGQSFILGYTNETHGVFHASEENPVIIFDDFTTSFHYIDFNFKIKSSAIKLLRVKKGANTTLRYVFYCMSSIKYVPKNHARQWISAYSKLKIPVPDIKIQNDIVEKLNKFHKYCTCLISGLPAEIERREKQYKYYLNKIFNQSEIFDTYNRDENTIARCGTAGYVN